MVPRREPEVEVILRRVDDNTKTFRIVPRRKPETEVVLPKQWQEKHSILAGPENIARCYAEHVFLKRAKKAGGRSVVQSIPTGHPLVHGFRVENGEKLFCDFRQDRRTVGELARMEARGRSRDRSQRQGLPRGRSAPEWCHCPDVISNRYPTEDDSPEDDSPEVVCMGRTLAGATILHPSGASATQRSYSMVQLATPMEPLQWATESIVVSQAPNPRMKKKKSRY